MPIKKENAARYPKDWKQIRQEVLERASHRCEQCGVINYVYRTPSGAVSLDADALLADGEPVTRIVLTIAHLNHVVEECGEPGNRPNLRALCQKCHLAWDHEHHMQNARTTRRSRKANGDLFA